MKKSNSKTESKSRLPEYSLSLSIVLHGKWNPETSSLLLQTFEKLKPELQKKTQFLAVCTQEDLAFANAFFMNPVLSNFNESDETSIISGLPSQLGFLIKNAFLQSKNEYVLTLDVTQLVKSFNSNDLFTIGAKGFEKDRLNVFSFQNESLKENISKNRYSILAFHSSLARYFGESIRLNASRFQKDLFWFTSKLQIEFNACVIPQNSAFADGDRKKSWVPGQALRRSLFWMIQLPWEERKSKPHLRYSFIKENSIYRLVFFCIASLFFVLMPLMSLPAGISGDEDKHVDQAQKVYNYFATAGKDTSYNYSRWGPFYAYNITFDVFLHMVIKAFNIDHIYEARHIMTSFTGWLAILFTGLFACLLAGWRAGILTMLFLFFTPSFLGHSFNNPKDIPFAFTYIFTIYFIAKFIKEYPVIRFSTSAWLAMGIAFSLNVRIGGLLLIAYLMMFAGLEFLGQMKKKEWFSKMNLKRLRKLILVMAGISLVGYILGFVFWPYGLKNPIQNPLESLKIMTNFTVSLRQIFEGKFIWSDNVPWYYSLKYMLITIPLAVVFAFTLFIFLFPIVWKRYRKMFVFMLLFTMIFPVFYVIYKKSNVYGGWRHLLFAYQMVVVGSVLGVEALLGLIKRNWVKISIVAPFLLLLGGPLRHYFVNHPHEYIYYNAFTGGVKGAFGKYETDYYYHSMREATLWLKEQIKPQLDTSTQKIVIASNYIEAVQYYTRDIRDKVKLIYTRYYDRGESNWDYGIYANSYMNPAQLRNKYYPPKHTIYRVEVDGMPICAVVERSNKQDYFGMQLLERGDTQNAKSYLISALEDNPNNEVALMGIARAYIESGQPDSSFSYLARLQKVYPDYDKGLNLLGVAYMSKNDLNSAMSVFERIIKVNPKFASAYHNLGLIYLRMNNLEMSANYLQQAIQANKSYKPSYLALAEILRRTGNNQQAEQVLDMARAIQ